MSRRRQPLRVAAALVLVMALCGTTLVRPEGARGQLQTGNLFGVVTDTDGAALPGVTVTLAGPGAPQVQVTDAEGRFRFLGLGPASYSLTAELEGFSPIEYPNITINVGRNTEIEVTLTPGTVAEDAGPVPVATPAPPPPPPPAPPPPPPPAPLTLTASGPGADPFTSTEFFRVLGRVEVCWEVTGEAPSGRRGAISILVFEQGRSVPQEPQGNLGDQSGAGCTSLDLPPGTYYLLVLSDFGTTSWWLSVRPG